MEELVGEAIGVVELAGAVEVALEMSVNPATLISTKTKKIFLYLKIKILKKA